MSDYEPQPELDDELLSAYLDDELSPAECAAVESRLSEDPSAQQLLHQLRSVSEAVQALPLEVVGHDMRESILRKAEQAREQTTVPGLRAVGEHADASNGEAAATLDAAPKFTLGQTRRGWIWASLAVAAALLIMVFGREPERDRLPAVAKVEGRAADETGRGRELAIRAPNEPAARPATSETAPPPPSDSSWQMTSDMDAEPAPTSGPQPRAMPLGLDTVTDLPSSPAAVPPQPGEEARSTYGGYADASAPPPTNKDESLAEGIAEMPAADRLAAAAPATEFHDASLADGIADASAVGQPAPPADEALAAEDPLVVVRVHAKRAALDGKTFDRLLERSGIEVGSADDDFGATTVEESTRSARRYAENGQAPAAVEPAPDQVKDDATVEAVLVEASPAAIAACMDGLSKDQENFVGLFVDDTSTVKAQSAAESAHNPEVFAKLKVAENLELSKYNRGIVPAEQESLDRDKYYSYGNDGAGFGGGRFGGAGGGERDLQQRQQGRLFRAQYAHRFKRRAGRAPQGMGHRGPAATGHSCAANDARRAG